MNPESRKKLFKGEMEILKILEADERETIWFERIIKA